jgi:hypothetical protein
METSASFEARSAPLPYSTSFFAQLEALELGHLSPTRVDTRHSSPSPTCHSKLGSLKRARASAVPSPAPQASTIFPARFSFHAAAANVAVFIFHRPYQNEADRNARPPSVNVSKSSTRPPVTR